MVNGFIFCNGAKVYFLESEKKVKCKAVIDAIIKKLCQRKGIEKSRWLQILNDEDTREMISYQTSKGTYELRTCSDGITQYHQFKEKYALMNFPIDDCDEVVFLGKENE